MTIGKTLSWTIAAFVTGGTALAQSPGKVNFMEYAQSNFDSFTSSPNSARQQWMQQNFARMAVWSPYFDSRTSWYPNAYVYQDLYGIFPGSWVTSAHPEWILHDQWGNWLYIPFNCGGGSCPMLAGDVANPAFRSWWIGNTQNVMNGGNYKNIFIDDVNMEFRVSDGWANQVAPIDSTTGQTMSYGAWRSYIATFTQQIRAALPWAQIMENTIWFANASGNQDSDSSIQTQIGTASQLNLERGIASDPGLTGGTGFWSVYNYFAFIDRVHAKGVGVNFQEYSLTPDQQQYGLASYFLISGGDDSLGDQTATPTNWWSGYNVNLGTPNGPRSYNNGVFQRSFSGGMVLLGEPGLSNRTIQLPGTFQKLDGSSVSSVSLGGSQGIILLGGSSGSSGASSNGSSGASGVSHYLSDLTPTYEVNGWNYIQNNLSVTMTPLTLANVQYSHGLGTHAYSEVRYALNGSCSSLSATVGVDNAVPWGAGSVQFQVWGDGKLLYASPFVNSATPATNFSINIAGIQTISLDATNGIWMAPLSTTTYDNADWVNPVVVCSS
ncbi:MAG: NPCBM/NEW2 domain-containing protein [Acidobacteriota bacterium]|nr:NPCBM/NEW2 domain-containing protein [Acidobacteriota bacterium]